MNNKLTAISLFCGAGGLDLGFEKAGFNIIWANDNDKDACETHSIWSNAEIVCDNVKNISYKSIPNADIILGGFPCQGFSLSGSRKIDDSRNTLYKYFVNIVRQKQPLCFIGENVKGLLTIGSGTIIRNIINDFSACGYDVFYQLVNAKHFGVPQDRERVILSGFRKDLCICDFKIKQPLTRVLTLRDVLNKNFDVCMSDVCTESYSSRYMSRNRKRDWNNISFTIPAMAKQVPLHPSSPDMVKISNDKWVFGNGSQTRRFSWQEAALIQTFPEDFYFIGSLNSKYRQIGNAVPVNLAYHVAVELKNML